MVLHGGLRLLSSCPFSRAGYPYTHINPETGQDSEYEFDDVNGNNIWDADETRHLLDQDDDGLPWSLEVLIGTDPGSFDTDMDGLDDGLEYDLHLNPDNGGNYNPVTWDSNNNGYSDHDEFYGCTSINYNVMGSGYSYFDYDGDGLENQDDAWPDDSSNGAYTPSADPTNTDSDADGVMDAYDSHPNEPSLWNDWNGNGYNDDNDPTQPPYTDPWTTDSDGDGVMDMYDSHSGDPNLWNDWNWNGVNDDAEPPDPYTTHSDSDGVADAYDSHPWDSNRWDDWNDNGINDSMETASGDIDFDNDGYLSSQDSNDNDPSIWSDWDGDGLNAENEPGVNADPNLADTDGDGLLDGEEVQYGTMANVKDSDGDGLTDYEELIVYASMSPPPSAVDAYSLAQAAGDSTQYMDYYKVDMTDSDPVNGTATGDGIPDRIEAFYGLDPTDATDAAGDLDSDGITNLQAYLAGLDLRANIGLTYDHDGDGISDAVEDLWNRKYPGMFDPYDDADATADPDMDGLLSFEEIQLGLDPGDPDSATAEIEAPFGVWDWNATYDIDGNELGGWWIWSQPSDSPDLIVAQQTHPTWTPRKILAIRRRRTQ